MPKPKFVPLTFTPSPPPTSPPPSPPPPPPPAKKTTQPIRLPKITSSTASKKTSHGSRSSQPPRQEKLPKNKHQPPPPPKKRIRHKEDVPLDQMSSRDLRRYEFLGKKVDEQKEKAGKEKIVPKKSIQQEEDLWDRTRQDARAWTSVSGMGSGEVWGMRKKEGYGGVMLRRMRDGAREEEDDEGGDGDGGKYMRGGIGVYRGRFNSGGFEGM